MAGRQAGKAIILASAARERCRGRARLEASLSSGNDRMLQVGSYERTGSHGTCWPTGRAKRRAVVAWGAGVRRGQINTAWEEGLSWHRVRLGSRKAGGRTRGDVFAGLMVRG